MQSRYTGFITSAEWRWVIFVAVALVATAFVPFLWVLMIGIAGSEWQFMGALHHYASGAAQLARVIQGADGLWLTRFLHTPETQNGALIDPIYALLGQVSRLTSLPPIAVFHAARVGAALFMYLAFYQLAAIIWMRVRTRRIFFVVVSIGSGLGWIFVPLTQSESFLDISASHVFPFVGMLANVHIPLAMACLALLASVIVVVFRPDETPAPKLDNGGGVLVVVSIILTLVYPLGLLPITLAFAVCLGIGWYSQGRADMVRLRWLMWMVAPVLPFLAYDIAVLRYNTVASQLWTAQQGVLSPSPLILILSLGIPLVVAVPGLYRAGRRFLPDGDQFMLVWAAAIVLLVFVPTAAQLRFVTGLVIPLTYFATRSIEDFWFQYIPRRWRLRVMACFVPLIAASNLFVLVLPIIPLSTNDFDKASGMLLERDYTRVFRWLADRVSAGDVILAAPDTSVWLPAWTGAQVVYGFPGGTIDAAARRRAVLDWYRETEPARCRDLLQGEYIVRYVLMGPQELELGQTICDRVLEPVGWFGEVRVYAYLPELYAELGR